MNYQRDHKLTFKLYELLLKKPFQNKRELQRNLEDEGCKGITTRDINQKLYKYSVLFEHGGESLPVWFARPVAKETLSLLFSIKEQLELPVYYIGPEPRAWQKEAFESWKAAGCRGVIEAVTGTGKTTVGILAAADAFDRGLKTLIVVPGIDLLEQWYEKLNENLRHLRIGRYGARYQDVMENFDIVVATVQSASRYIMLSENTSGLIIADEVHRFGAETYQLALENEFTDRLGLTATFERDDKGLDTYLVPYFMPLDKNFHAECIIFKCNFSRGLTDKILSNFRVGLIPVEFDENDMEDYFMYDEQLKKTRFRLIKIHGCPEEPYGEFMKHTTQLSKGGTDNFAATVDARRYLDLFTKRRAILAETDGKLDAISLLQPIISASNGTLIFTETITSAKSIAEDLSENGILALDYTSDLKREERKFRLEAFRNGIIKVLIAPKILNEGVDLPEADVGIIVSASRSRIQMIQRMGRIIRPKTDGRSATFFILFVKDTFEDPEMGAHGAFLGEMIDTADEVRSFPLVVSSQKLLKWFNRK